MVTPIFSTEQVTAFVGGYLWPMARVSGLVLSAPYLSTRSIPAHIKIIIILTMTAVMLPQLPPVPRVDPLSLQSFTILANQLVIGVIMGFIIQMVFGTFIIGGQIIAMQTGLGFSQMVDPMTGVDAPVLSQFYSIMVTLIFFSLNGHLAMMQIMADSFQKVPIGMHSLGKDQLWLVTNWIGYVFVSAVLIALPAIAAIMMVNLTLGVITRAAPQFNIFSIGFPINMILGYAIIAVTLPMMMNSFGGLMSDGFVLINDLFGGTP